MNKLWLLFLPALIGCAGLPARSLRAPEALTRIAYHPPAAETSPPASRSQFRPLFISEESAPISGDILAGSLLDTEPPLRVLEPLAEDEIRWQGSHGIFNAEFADSVQSDYRHFYSAEMLAPFLMGLGAAATLANTHADEGIRDFYQDNIRETTTDEWSRALHTPTILGNGMITLPVFLGAALIGDLYDDQPPAQMAAEWGERSLRIFIVGAPPMYALQFITGGSRPGESPQLSAWQPLADNNGVSGHSFMGAVPFLAAAQIAEDPWLKAGLYGASTLAGLSRINDDAHYTSQVIMGWWMAYLAASAVSVTESENPNWRIIPLPATDGFQLGFEYRH